MSLTTLSIGGYRGFNATQTLSLAVPANVPGSGLTIVVGSNNAGKSTIVEALRYCAGDGAPSFSEGRRNVLANGRVRITITNDVPGDSSAIETIAAGGSETERRGNPLPEDILALPSRRHFNPYFGKSGQSRNQYVSNLKSRQPRGGTLDAFAFRLFEIQKDRSAFDSLLADVLDPVPEWMIDQAENGEFYLKFSSGTGTHNSEGMGEGLVSLLVIVDALYDSKPGGLIAIDEPELSIHPSVQRKLASLFARFAKDRQIVVATHSPYFVDLGALAVGGKIARVHQTERGSVISALTIDTGKELTTLLADERNPHVLGLDAREVFFLSERVVLVEGQDDVVQYASIEAQTGVKLPGSYFGWGVGGAEKMRLIAQMLREMGFLRVVGILDNDRAAFVQELNTQFPEYLFEAIPAKDVRTKKEVKARPAVEGLLDKDGVLRPELKNETASLLERLRAQLTGEALSGPATGSADTARLATGG